MLIALIAIHAGMGFTQGVVSYYAGDIADHGTAGWLSHTPAGTFIDLEGQQRASQQGEANPSNLKAMFDFVNNLGDAVNGLASFGYGFLQEIKPEDGLAYNVVMAVRVMSVLFWLGLGVALIYFLFDSGLLTSKLGLLTIGLGLGLGGVSGVGAAVS